MITTASTLDLGTWSFPVHSWPHFGTYETFVQSDLLPEVKSLLKKYERFIL